MSDSFRSPGDSSIPITLKQLEAFTFAAELGSFTAAADALERAQPTVSKEIKTLEHRLRTTLFTRHGRSTSLTPKGEELLSRAQEVVNGARALVGSARSDRALLAQQVSIACSPSLVNVFMPRLLQSVESELPDVRLSVHECDTGEVENYLKSKRIDLGLCHVARSTANYQIIPLRNDPLFVVGEPGVLSTIESSDDLSILTHTPLLSWPQTKHPEYFQLMMEVCRSRGLDPLIISGSARLTGSKRYLLSQGRAFGIMPKDALEGLAEGIEYLPLTNAAVSLDCLVVNQPREVVRTVLRMILRLSRNYD